MVLVKDAFIHNRLIFDETEKDALTSAYKIIDLVRSANIHSSGKEDSFLNEQCDRILFGISELLNNYSNEYPETCE